MSYKRMVLCDICGKEIDDSSDYHYTIGKIIHDHGSYIGYIDDQHICQECTNNLGISDIFDKLFKDIKEINCEEEQSSVK